MSAVSALVQSVTNEIVNPILGVLFAVALGYFVFGATKLIFGASSDQDRAQGKRHLLWGLIGMTIMVSVFAILVVGLNTIGVDSSELPTNLPINGML